MKTVILLIKNKQIVVGHEWGILSVFQRYKNFLPSLCSDKSGGSIHRARLSLLSRCLPVVVGVVGLDCWGVFSMTFPSWDQEAF